MQRFLLAVLTSLLAQQPAPQPTFKSGVNLIEVDVVVTNKTGQPVRGLGQADFEVTEDGKPVTISTFVAVDLPAAPAGSPIPPPDRSGTSIASNDQPEDGRVILIVLDDYHVRFDAGFAVRTRAVARRLVEQLGPSDQAAVMATSGRTSNQAEFTGDKARLLEAIDRFFPQSEMTSSAGTVQGAIGRGLTMPAGRGMGYIEEIKARWAMEAMSNAAKGLARIPHRRKTVLFVSEGIPASVEDIVSSQSANAAWASLREFILTAQRSNVAVYPVDPCGLSSECSFSAQQNLRTLAESTGGFAVVNTNKPEDAVERIVAENGTYYLLGYVSPAPLNDGRRHRIRVKTRVPDVEVRARNEYWADRRPAKPQTPDAPVDALVGSPIQTRGLTLRVAAVPAPLASSPGASIVVAIELPAKDAVAAGSVDFSVLAIDAAGKIQARQRFNNTFEVKGAAVAGWVRLRSHIPVKPGPYLIRVAGVGANKTQGSVYTEVTVPKFDDDLVLGGLSLTLPVAVPLVNPRQASTAPDLSPLATSDVPAGMPITASVPIRISSKAAAKPFTVTATLSGPDGRTVDLGSGPRQTSGFATSTGEIFRAVLPAGLVPGAYRLAVEAISGGERVTRELRFRVTATE